jgi:hypothetical protein
MRYAHILERGLDLLAAGQDAAAGRLQTRAPPVVIQ